MVYSLIKMLILVFLYIFAINNCSYARNYFNIISVDAEPPNYISANISWMKFRKNTHCIRILDEFMPNCLYEALFNANIKVWKQSLSSYVDRNISKESGPTDCESFLLTSNGVSALFSQNPPLRRFYPFTRVFIVGIESNSADKSSFSMKKNDLNYIYTNGLEVFFTDSWQISSNGELIFREIKNALTRKSMNLSDYTKKGLERFYDSFRKHPFLDLTDSNKTFTYTSFNSSPYFIHFDGKNDKR